MLLTKKSSHAVPAAASSASPFVHSLRRGLSQALPTMDRRSFLRRSGLGLGVGLAATQPRRATNWNLLLALLGFIVYFNLINLSQAWIASGKAAMGPVMLALHGGMLVLALALIWWRDHAAVLAWWPRRKAAA